MSIIIKNVLVEAHHSIEMIVRYHELLRRVYSIIVVEISDINFELILQMTFKAINDSIDSNKLVSTLLIFDVYSRMIESDASSLIITQRAVVIRIVMNEIRKSLASRQVNDALNTRNESFTEAVHELSLNFRVLIFREEKIDQFES
jgi:hypothetical protein